MLKAVMVLDELDFARRCGAMGRIIDQSNERRGSLSFLYDSKIQQKAATTTQTRENTTACQPTGR